MDHPFLSVLAVIGAISIALFVFHHIKQIIKGIRDFRAKVASSGLPGQIETRIAELERIVKQHDAALVNAAPNSQPAPVAAPPA